MKIALIDDPKNCRDCPLYSHHICWHTQRTPEDDRKIPEWCKLKDLPSYKPIDENNDHPINDGYVIGWNACLTEITWGGE